MSAFSQLKKNRQKNNERLLEQLKNNAKGGGEREKDSRFYYPARDEQGNGYAVIRFLPEKDLNVPYVRVYSHGFKGPGGKWFINNCPTTLGKGHSCPVCEANSEAWEKGQEYYKANASHRKRRTAFIANVLVVRDPKNPENEGKVFLFQFGTKIMDMISSAADPQFEDDKPMNAFDLDDGANFKLKIVKKDGNTNYDKSEFEGPSSVADGDEEAQEEIWNKCYNLGEFIDPKKFKEYEQLEKEFAAVMNGSAPSRRAGEDDSDDKADDDEKTNRPSRSRREKPEEKAAESRSPRSAERKERQSSGSAEDDDPIKFFEGLSGD